MLPCEPDEPGSQLQPGGGEPDRVAEFVAAGGAGAPDALATAMHPGVVAGPGAVAVPDPPGGVVDEACGGAGDGWEVPGAVLGEDLQGLPVVGAVEGDEGLVRVCSSTLRARPVSHSTKRAKPGRVKQKWKGLRSACQRVHSWLPSCGTSRVRDSQGLLRTTLTASLARDLRQHHSGSNLPAKSWISTEKSWKRLIHF
jgi:hypothetical protein